MAREINDWTYEDNYVKHQCQECRRDFIVGERLSEGMSISCPYCRAEKTEVRAYTDDETLEDVNLGCVGFTYKVYDDGDLMLYTREEEDFAFRKAEEYLKDTKGEENYKGVPFDVLGEVLYVHCMQRDGKTALPN